MKINRSTLFLLIVCGLLNSCVDLNSKRHNIDGTYFAMFRDKFGIEWMVKFDPVAGKSN